MRGPSRRARAPEAASACTRPIADEAHDTFLSLINAKMKEGDPFADAMLKGYQAFLCSGHFLYLTEPAGHGDPQRQRGSIEDDRPSSLTRRVANEVDPYALASRLSHLLWNSRPDDAMLSLAATGELGERDTLVAEVDRLIDDERFDRFVSNFTDQWLDLRQVRRDNPDIRLYPEYRKDDYLVDSMERETKTFFATMVRDNLPITTVVDADFTFVNDTLAAHYGISRQSGSAMRKVDLPDRSPYGGLLTQASVLKLTSHGTTTSPVVRGAWVMEKLLGQPPPPPPRNSSRDCAGHPRCRNHS